MSMALQSRFAGALLPHHQVLPAGLMAWHGQQPERRFAVYRNNIASGLSRALAARFPAAEKIVGSAFFTAMAREFVTQHPPRSPVLLGYGDDFAAFVAGFQPAESVPYLADVIRLEAARGHAYHAADVLPLNPATLSALEGGRLAALRFESHPAVSIIRSPHPIVTIWAMNADEMALAPIEIWTPEDALIVRPRLTVFVQTLPPGAAKFLEALIAGETLGDAVDLAFAETDAFDLTASLTGALQAGVFTAFR
jgi:hypothetical protein